MANVLNPETESITLNTTLETPTLEPATELDQLASIDQPLRESTSNPESSVAVEVTPLDADALTQPAVEAELEEALATPPAETPAVTAAALTQPAVTAELPAAEAELPVVEPELPAVEPELPVAEAELPAAEAELPAVEAELPIIPTTPPAETPAVTVAADAPAAASGEPGEDFAAADFSSALAAFEREQAAEAAAVEAFGDKIVSGKVIELREKFLVVDVGLKSEGLVPLEQVVDHTGAVKFQPGDEIDVVIEREEPEGGYLVSYERAQRLRVWDTIEKAASDKTPIKGTVVSRVKGGLTVDIGIKAFLPGSQLEIRPVRNLDAYLGQPIEVRVIKLNKKRGNVVVSRKEIRRKSRTASARPPWST